MKYRYSLILLLTTAIVTNIFGQFAGIKDEGYNKLYHTNGTLASEGFSKNGKPEGFWKSYYEDGTLKSSGNRQGYALNGLWKFYHPNGAISAEINYRDNMKNGFAQFFSDSGAIASKLYYVNNEKEGEAIQFYSSGKMKMKENYKDDKLHGETREYSEDGRVIVLYFYEEGILQKTQKINRFNEERLKQGLWITFHANENKKLEGGYVDGKKHGIFKEYDVMGNLIAIYKYENGVISEESSELSVLDTKYTYYTNAKVKTEATYRDSLLQGYRLTYDENGNIIHSEFFDKGIKLSEGLTDKQGREQGKWKYFYETGELQAEGKYKDGLKIEIWKYFYKDSTLEQTGKYILGKPDDEWIWYYPDKTVRREENYDRGVRDGRLEEFNEDGELITKGTYRDGEKFGKWFYALGDHEEEGRYRYGKKDGEWKHYYIGPPTDPYQSSEFDFYADDPYEDDPYEEEEDDYWDDEELTPKQKAKQLRQKAKEKEKKKGKEEKEPSFIGNYNEGALDGKQLFFYRDGVIMVSQEYRVGERVGTWTYYTEEGSISFSETYENDELIKINGQNLLSKKQRTKE